MNIDRNRKDGLIRAFGPTRPTEGFRIQLVMGLASVLDEANNTEPRGVAWESEDVEHGLVVQGDDLAHVTRRGGELVATRYQRRDVRRVTASQFADTDEFSGLEWTVKEWTVLLADGEVITLTASDRTAADRIAEILRLL